MRIPWIPWTPWQERLLANYRVNKEIPSTKGTDGIYSFCWDWQKGRTQNGYGRLNADGIPMGTHVLSYRLFNGMFPELNASGELHVIMHLCDRPICISPSHIRLGTHKENNLDMRLKGRATHPTPTSEQRHERLNRAANKYKLTHRNEINRRQNKYREEHREEYNRSERERRRAKKKLLNPQSPESLGIKGNQVECPGELPKPTPIAEFPTGPLHFKNSG